MGDPGLEDLVDGLQTAVVVLEILKHLIDLVGSPFEEFLRLHQSMIDQLGVELVDDGLVDVCDNVSPGLAILEVNHKILEELLLGLVLLEPDPSQQRLND